jgi:hypothetical protein
MAGELSPEQIAKGYYTDISGIGTALDKVQEQEALRAKAKQAQQDKLYQGIKDVSSALDNKFTATGTAADPILLSQINQLKGDLTQGIMNGKISPASAYMLASTKVADVNNLAGTVSQFRTNVEKKIAEIKKDRPELNQELLTNDVIKQGIFDPQTGQIVTPNSNYDYVSTILDQDRTGRYSDKNIIHKLSAEDFIKAPGSTFTLNLGNGIESQATVRPGQRVVRNEQGGLGVDYDRQRVGESIQETTVKEKGKPVKRSVNVGLFDGATDELISYFEGNRLAKRGALIEMGEMDEYADNNPEYGKKWNPLNDQEKYRVAALNYAVKHFGTAGSKVERPSVSAQTQLAMEQARLAKSSSSESGDKKNDYSGLLDAIKITTGVADAFINAQATNIEFKDLQTKNGKTVVNRNIPVLDLTNMVSKGLDKNLEDGHGHLIKVYFDKIGNKVILNYKNKTSPEDTEGGTTYETKEFDASSEKKILEAFGTVGQSVGVSPSKLRKLIQGK